VAFVLVAGTVDIVHIVVADQVELVADGPCEQKTSCFVRSMGTVNFLV
jgi:hypothetical protein